MNQIPSSVNPGNLEPPRNPPANEPPLAADRPAEAPNPQVDTLEECSTACCFYCPPVHYVCFHLWAVSLEIYSFFLSSNSKFALFTEQKIPEFFPPEIKKMAQKVLRYFFIQALGNLTDLHGLEEICIPKALEETEFADECLEKLRQRRSEQL